MRRAGPLMLSVAALLSGVSGFVLAEAPDAARDASAEAPDAGVAASDAEVPGPEAPAEGPPEEAAGAAEADAEEADAEEADAEVAKARKRPPKDIRIPAQGGGVIYVITIDETIDLGLAPYVERVIEEAEADPEAVAVISEIHTPGGRVDAAVRIRDALLDSELPTLAFVDSEAISAGALIALAHDYIIMTPGGTIGAATPIQAGGGGGEAQPVGEKMTSYVRGVFRSTAEAKDRDPVLAEAMVDAEVDVPGLAPEGKLLTATSKEAFAWGLVDAVVEDAEEMRRRAGIEGARFERRETSWAEGVARFLTNPMVSGLLMSFGFLGILMEFYSPGFGVLGGIGITCLLLFFFGHQAVHLAGFEELTVFGVGFALILLEVFVTPGFGILGALGVIAVLVSLVMTLMAYPLDVSIETGELTRVLLRVLASVAGTVAVSILVVGRLVKSGPFGRLVLADEIAGRAVGFGDRSEGEPGREGLLDEAPPIGTPGVAQTSLRPSGKVRVAGRTFDAVTTGDLLAPGTAIEVRGAKGSALLVRAAPPAADAPPETDDPGAEGEGDHGS